MAPRPKKPAHLSQADARAIWLRAQRLDSETPFGAGPQAVPAAVELAHRLAQAGFTERLAARVASAGRAGQDAPASSGEAEAGE